MVSIKKEFDNKLLKRKEVKATITLDGATLSRKEVKQKLAKKFKVEENVIIVNEISSHFGSRSVDVDVFIYEDEKTLNAVTLKHIKKRNEEKPQQEEQEA